MENTINASAMNSLAFDACCENPEFSELLDSSANLITERASQGYMSINLSTEDFPILSKNKYRNVFQDYLRSLGFKTEDIIKINDNNLSLNYIRISWYIPN